VRQRKLGKLAVRHDPRTLKLGNYLGAIPELPAAMDWFSGIKDWGMMGNDKIGLCTCAALGHMLQAESAALGSEYTVPDATVIAAYSAITGYDPETGANDNGAVELDVLNWFRQNGFGGKSLLAYAAVNPLNHDHSKLTIWQFCGAYIGLALPVSAQEQLDDGRPWDVVRGPNGIAGSWGGHAVPVIGYDDKYVTCVTWGQLQKMTWAFWDKYCEEAYALLTSDWSKFGACDYFQVSDLQKALAEITN